MKWLKLIGLFEFILASACDRRAPAGVEAQPPPSASQASIRPIAISVDASGYHPDSVRAAPGKQARLVFTRTSDEGCGHQLVFPTLTIQKDLPLNQPVTVDIAMPESGSIAFTCGMDMLRGAVVAE